MDLTTSDNMQIYDAPSKIYPMVPTSGSGLIIPKMASIKNSTRTKTSERKKKEEKKNGSTIKSVDPRIYKSISNNTENILTRKAEDPWIYKPISNNKEIKLTAVTPLGHVPNVPTYTACKVSNLMTPARILLMGGDKQKEKAEKAEKERREELEYKELLKTIVGCNFKDENNKKKEYIANKMQSLSEATLNSKKFYNNKLKDLIPFKGIVKEKDFDDILEIYENNQVYYQDILEEITNQADKEKIKEKLTELEHWFICIIEPKPKDPEDMKDWVEREKYKLDNGYTIYCDKDLYKYINPAPISIRTYIWECLQETY